MVEGVMTVGRLPAHGREQNIWFGKFKLPAVTRLKKYKQGFRQGIKCDKNIC